MPRMFSIGTPYDGQNTLSSCPDMMKSSKESERCFNDYCETVFFIQLLYHKGMAGECKEGIDDFSLFSCLNPAGTNHTKNGPGTPVRSRFQ